MWSGKNGVKQSTWLVYIPTDAERYNVLCSTRFLFPVSKCSFFTHMKTSKGRMPSAAQSTITKDECLQQHKAQ
jgi:hypothetical protein